MARIPSQEPYLSVVPSPKDGPTQYRWTVYHVVNGVPSEKQGKVGIARVAKQTGLSPTKAVRETERLAREAGEQALKEILGGCQSNVWTLRSWCDYCTEKIIAKERDVRYAMQIKAQLDLHVHEMLGSVPLNKLSAEQLLAWWEWREKTPSATPIYNRSGEVIGRKSPRLLAWKTRDLIRGYLSTCLERARRRNHINWNPADSIPCDRKARERYEESRPERLQWLSLDQLRLVLHGARGTSIYAPVLIQVDLAARAAEACGLPMQDVDPATGKVDVKRQLARKPEVFGGASSLKIGDPKGMERPFRASEELRRLVRSRLAENELLKPDARLPYVALGPGRSPMDPNWYSKQFRRLCRSLDIELKKGNSSHVIRRSVLNLLKDAPGVSKETRSLIAGHVDQATTDIYLEDKLTKAQSGELSVASDWLSEKLRG